MLGPAVGRGDGVASVAIGGSAAATDKATGVGGAPGGTGPPGSPAGAPDGGGGDVVAVDAGSPGKLGASVRSVDIGPSGPRLAGRGRGMGGTAVAVAVPKEAGGGPLGPCSAGAAMLLPAPRDASSSALAASIAAHPK